MTDRSWFVGLALCAALLAARPAGSDPVAEARAVLDRARAAYEGARTYRDTAIVRHEMTPAGGDGDAQINEVETEFLFSRPCSIVLRNEFGGVYCDGARLWVHNARTGEYTESAAPGAIDLRELDRALPSVHLASHPLAGALAGGDRLPALLSPDVHELTGTAPAWLDSEPGRRVWARGSGDIPIGERSSMTLWFPDRTGLLGEIAIDLTVAHRRAAEQTCAGTDDEKRPAATRFERVTMTTRLRGVRLDEEIAPEAFIFEPGPNDRLVGQLSDPSELVRSEQAGMIGEPAPEIDGMTLDGGKLRLSDLKGRIVVLVFWDTWCCPSVRAISVCQELWEKHGQAPLTVVGVNQDQPHAEERVRRLLDEKRVTFCQLRDGENAIARAYSVPGIPCTVLIDDNGEVRKIGVGFARAQEEALAEDIRALLASRSLRGPAGRISERQDGSP